MLALFVGAGVATVVLVVGLALAVTYAVRSPHRSTRAVADNAVRADRTIPRAGADDARDELANEPMPTVDEDASHPGPVSTKDPGPPIMLPVATTTGPAHVSTGFPRTPQGALAQLAAIDQTAMQSGSLQEARHVIAMWALPGGPTPSNWSGVRALAQFFDAIGLSGAGSNQLALVVTPLMGQIKGSVGSDFVVPCVDFEIDVTLQQTSRGAAADCQRMEWTGTRWMVSPGGEPADAPSVWPDTDLAFAVGFHDLRQETGR